MRLKHLPLWIFIALCLPVACRRPEPTPAATPVQDLAVSGTETTTPPSSQELLRPTHVTRPTEIPPTPTFTPSPVPEPQGEVTPGGGAGPTPRPTTTATQEPIALPTATPTPVPIVTPHADYFEIGSVEDFGDGKRVTFRWQAGGGYARIVSGTAQRLGPWWTVPLSGTLTVELEYTHFRDPQFVLEVYAQEEPLSLPQEMATATAQIEWACQPDYFFTPLPRRCPLGPAEQTEAAQQAFQGGRMLWLAQTNHVVIFYDNGRWERFEDTWSPDQPESDPQIRPPQGFYQPVRGFGKVWREHPQVRGQLGWALAPEQAYTATLQHAHHEGSSSGAPSYVSLANGEVLMLSPFFIGSGEWQRAGVEG